MESTNGSGCAKTIAILASIATIIAVVIAVLAWLLPFSPVGTSPLAPRSSEKTEPNSQVSNQPDVLNGGANETSKFTVSANQSWQDTGVTLSAGDNISITYLSGQWDWTSEYPDFDAQGDPNPQNTCEHISKLIAPGATPGICALPSAQAGALVGKIGNGTPFLVGDNYTFTISNNVKSGTRLYLMNNDVFDGLGDNSGKIEVMISISSQ